MERPYNEDRLSAFFDGEMPLNERSEMEALLRASPEMRRTLDDFQRQRNWLAALPKPELSEGFSNRVMAQVLAAAGTTEAPKAATVVPPPFPVRPKRRSFSLVANIALSAAATIAIGYFLIDQANKNPDGDKFVKDDPHTAVVAPDSTEPNTPTPESKLNTQGEAPKIVASDPENSEATNPLNANVPEAAIPANDSIAKDSSKEIPALNNSEAQKNITNAKTPMPSGNGVLAANTPKPNPKATMKTRPKAYRVQVGTQSEFESRLKDAGIPFYHGKAINPPSDATKALRDTVPDPVYVVVEGTESQLSDLVKKLQSQADLAMFELIGDLEAEFLLSAIANIDAAGESLRPDEAKDEELAGYLYPAKALRSLIPANLPTKGSLPAVKSGEPAPRVLEKSAEEKGESLYVPRVIFILDVRMGEAEGKPAK